MCEKVINVSSLPKLGALSTSAQKYQGNIPVGKEVYVLLDNSNESRCLLRSLLEVKHILDHSDSRFHLSRLYIDDYCVYIQTVRLECWTELQLMDLFSRKKLKSLSKELQKVQITKEDIGWPLEELEAQAMLKATELEDSAEEWLATSTNNFDIPVVSTCLFSKPTGGRRWV